MLNEQVLNDQMANNNLVMMSKKELKRFHVESQEKSGLSISEYARIKGISLKKLYIWRAQIKNKSNKKAEPNVRYVKKDSEISLSENEVIKEDLQKSKPLGCRNKKIATIRLDGSIDLYQNIDSYSLETFLVSVKRILDKNK